ncbi:MAG: methyltransferase domain-containing protein [Kiritimatiellae bacterium]|nr:methyltransferase domain-containing protein [Kiritimatiellia bacterium]
MVISGVCSLLIGKAWAFFGSKSVLWAVVPLCRPAAPDLVSSSDAYALRFRGGVGKWHLDVQRKTLLRMLAPRPGVTVLDVGGGHGQYAKDLIDLRYDLTILGSEPQSAPRIAPLVSEGKCRFVTGHFLNLPQADRSFDTVVSIRQFSHMENWEGFLSELCRVAERAVIFDAPVSRSFNIASRLLFSIKRRIENRTTRPFAVRSEQEIVDALGRSGFSVTGRAPQFFFPMALHRLVRWAPLVRMVEGLCRVAGLTRMFGSPVIFRAERVSP